MVTNKYPHFQKGRILKRGMLESLRDYPRDIVDLYFQNYSDGIITGLDITVDGTNLIIAKGIVKQQGTIYTLTTDYTLSYTATERETALLLEFDEPQLTPDYTEYTARPLLVDATAVMDNTLELARFKLKAGAMLRASYTDFADLATEYNTLNYLYCQYAGLQQSTYHPMLLKYYARELLESRSTNPYDISFALQCLNQERIEREVVDWYISSRLEVAYQPLSNKQAHHYLTRILSNGQNSRRRADAHTGRPVRMLVD
ncbi:DNA and RNA helicase [Metasolibacillus sp. FSL H7-0170]|uniref:DNA and RNA helicase n=1 Tax=Metasolibacillus TaxID=2703677 RepID=UPI000799EEB3|nr:DNA and RNA helicase [Metasolibacillus fluoroglycofenilyticus]KYG92212.1 DNA and RNA helicase [[Bacillus] sp. KCTC 13219]